MSITLSPVASLPLVAVITAGLLAFVWFVYRPRIASLPTWSRRTVLSLRIATTILLIALLFRPTLERDQDDDRRGQLLVLADASRSMSVADGEAGRTRRDLALQVVRSIADRLGDDSEIDVQTYDFADTLTPATEFTASADGEWTDIGTAIESAEDRSRDARVVGMLMLSDGRVRTPKPSGEAVVSAAESFVQTTGVGITPVGIGSSSQSDEGVDLAIENVLADPVTFEKKVVRVRASVRLRRFEGRDATVRLFIENASEAVDPAGVEESDLTAGMTPIRADPETRPSRIVRGTASNDPVPIDLSFLATQPGEYKVRVLVEPDGDEVVTTNNYRDFLIRVRSGGLRVLYVDSARWEQKFIRLVNASSQIQLDYRFAPSREAFEELLADEGWFDTAEYDVFLVGDVPASVFRSSGRGSISEQLRAAVDRGAGVGLIAGPSVAASPIKGPLGDLLPASFASPKPAALEDGRRLFPTPDGLSHFVLRLGDEGVFDRLPPLERVFPLTPANEVVDVLAETTDAQPLIVAAEAGRGRTMMIAMADTWLWYRSGNPSTHQRFWQQVLLWLGRKETDGDVGLRVAASPRQVDRGEAVTVDASIVDTEGNMATDGSTISLDLIPPGGTAGQILDGGSAGGVTAEIEDTMTPGDYTVRARRIGADGQTLEERTTRFLVNATDPELDNPATDLATLERIAQASGGLTITPEEVDDWVDELVASLEASDSVRKEIIPLWDGWPPLILFAVLMTAEWAIRKSGGLV